MRIFKGDTMKQKTRNISLLALAAGVVIVPLIRYLIQKRRMTPELQTGYNPSPEITKGLFSAYRGGRLPHRRNPGPKNGYPLH